MLSIRGKTPTLQLLLKYHIGPIDVLLQKIYVALVYNLKDIHVPWNKISTFWLLKLDEPHNIIMKGVNLCWAKRPPQETSYRSNKISDLSSLFFSGKGISIFRKILI